MFYDLLPRKRIAAGALIAIDSSLLIVKPRYKPQWDLPGGIVEANESPRAGLQREIREELGVSVVVGDLRLVSYTGAIGAKTEALYFIFSVDLTRGECDRFVFSDGELEEWRLVSFGECFD